MLGTLSSIQELPAVVPYIKTKLTTGEQGTEGRNFLGRAGSSVRELRFSGLPLLWEATNVTIKHWAAFDLWVSHSVFLAQRGHICSSLIHRADSGLTICFPQGYVAGCNLLSGHKIVALAKTGHFVKSWKFIDNRCICQSNLLSRQPRWLWCVQHIRHDLKQKMYAVGWHAKYRSVSFLF